MIISLLWYIKKTIYPERNGLQHLKNIKYCLTKKKENTNKECLSGTDKHDKIVSKCQVLKRNVFEKSFVTFEFLQLSVKDGLDDRSNLMPQMPSTADKLPIYKYHNHIKDVFWVCGMQRCYFKVTLWQDRIRKRGFINKRHLGE